MNGALRSPLRIVGLLLVVLGILGAVSGRLTYTEETHDASIGPIEISVKDRETIRIPLWAGVLTAIAGAALIVVPKGRN